MSAPDEIRSTEKLLDLIRNSSATYGYNTNSVNKESESKPQRKISFDALRIKKRYTIGVDIGHTYIKMAKIARTADKSYELIDYFEIPLKKQISLKDPELLQKLKVALDQICEGVNNYAIWSAIASAKVETKYLKIPKLHRKKIPNAIFWTFTKNINFDEQEEILDYEILGDVAESGVKKSEVTAFKVPRQEVNDLALAFNQIGYPLSGISIAPFAIQNLFRAKIITPREQDVCCLYVGRDWSRIVIFSKGNLILSRGIKAGMRSMVEAIAIAMSHKDEAWQDQNHAQTPAEHKKNQNNHVVQIHPNAQKAFFKLLKTDPQDSASLPTSDLFQMVLPALDRLIRQVERTFEHYMMHYNREGVRRIYLSGQITASEMIVNHFGRQLDLPTEVMNPFVPASSFVRSVNIPDNQETRESYVPSIGLALSDNDITPNSLFTHEDKNREEDIRSNNMRVLTVCLLVLMILIAAFSWQERELDSKRNHIDKLNQKLFSYNPPADKEVLLGLYNQNKNKRKTLEQIVKRYAPLSVINELALITPANIRLINIDINFDKTDQKKAKDESNILIEGIIFSTPDNIETVLTGYLLTLKKSPLFNRPTVLKKQGQYYNNQKVMHFTAKLDLI